MTAVAADPDEVAELMALQAQLSVYETAEEHAKRPCGAFAKCGRCMWNKHAAKWQRRLAVPIGGELKCPIVERLPDWGGPWAIGCAPCWQAGFKNKYATFRVNQKGAIRICNLEEHCNSPHHKFAMRKLLDPTLDTVFADCVGDDKDDGFGDIPGAPSSATYAYALSAFLNACSRRASACLSGLANLFGLDDEDGVVDESRKTHTACLCTMAYVCDDEARQHVKRCDSIAIQGDGRRTRLVLTASGTEHSTLTCIT